MSDIRIVSIKQRSHVDMASHEEVVHIQLSDGRFAGGSSSLPSDIVMNGDVTRDMIVNCKQEALLNAFNYILSNSLKDSA